MRIVEEGRVVEAVRRLAFEANWKLPQGLLEALERARLREIAPLAQVILGDLLENARLAFERKRPVCQDCGLAVVFVDLGEAVRVSGAGLEKSINEGIRQGYLEGYLRKSVVDDPLYDRKNTGDNTPAIIHVRFVPGEVMRITVAPKGMGSENASAIAMLKPSDGESEIEAFVERTLLNAGPNPCPPVVLGIGIGGNFETAPLLAKRALLRPMGSRHPDLRYAALEERLLEAANRLGIGPGGLGGATTALDVRIEEGPTHMAGLPVAVNVSCHALRHASCEL